MSVGRIITGDACVAEGAAWLAQNDAGMKRAYGATGPLPLRLRADGFGALLNAIVSQQVSVASARAIWARIETAGMDRVEHVRAASEEDLRGLGLSRPKVRYVQALTEAAIDYEALRGAPEEEVIRTLTDVTGIGAWTAEIYLMFSLGRADVFAAGDLALQEAARELYALEARPNERAMREMATQWSPWRSVAARQLFAYYRVIKQRDGLS